MTNIDKKYVDGDYAGTVKLSWEIPEFQDYKRGKTWYITAGIIGILLLIYSIFTANLLFGVIIIVAAVTLIKIDKTKPDNLEFTITTKGILVGNSFYEYEDIRDFYIIYEPPEIENLYFEFKNVARPRISIPLYDQDPIAVRKLLKKYIEEDLEKQGEPISDALGKIFKL